MIDLAQLRHISFFEDFNDSELDVFASIAAASHWREGDIVFNYGSPATHLYIIRSGTVLLTFSKGRSLPLHFPETLGWRSLVSPFRHQATAMCLTDVDLIQFSSSELHRVIQMDSKIALQLMERIRYVMMERKPYSRNFHTSR